MSAWTDLGLPLPNASGYSYLRDAALVRSPFVSAMQDQSQRNTNWRKTFEISWNLTLEQLPIAEQYLLQYGYSWFDIELLSNETPVNDVISLHKVRLTSNYKIQPIGGMLLKLSAVLETKVIPQSCELITCDTISDIKEPECDFKPEVSIIIPTTLYPVELYDELTSVSQIVSGFMSPYMEDAYTSEHKFLSGEIVVTKILVPITQPPDAYTSEHIFTYGEIYVAKIVIPITQPPDAYQSEHIFTFGEIIDDYISVTTQVIEDITSTAIIISGTLE